MSNIERTITEFIPHRDNYCIKPLAEALKKLVNECEQKNKNLEGESYEEYNDHDLNDSYNEGKLDFLYNLSKLFEPDFHKEG